MTAFPVRIGVDEIATETQRCEGFCFFCLPEEHVVNFTKETQAILNSADLDSFHGKEFRPEHTQAYQDFLSVMFSNMRKLPQSFAACRLFSATVKSELERFCDRSVASVVGKSLGWGHESIPILQSYFFPLACLAALSRELAPNIQMYVEMDSHTSLRDLSQTVHHALGLQIEVTTLLKDLYNEYAKAMHERTPLLPDNGVNVLDDEASVMVQAADVIGNFAIAHIFVLLGKETTGRKAKSQILTEVFGNEISVFDPDGRLAFSGNDLLLSDDGSITFKAAWRLSKPPDDPELREDWPQDDGFLGKGRV